MSKYHLHSHLKQPTHLIDEPTPWMAFASLFNEIYFVFYQEVIFIYFIYWYIIYVRDIPCFEIVYILQNKGN